MKQTKSKTRTGNNSRLAPINRYLTYPGRYDEIDVLDTDEDRIMNYHALEPVDVLDTDEDVIMQYYKYSFNKETQGREKIYMPKRIINLLLLRSYCLFIFILSFCCATAQQIVYPYPVRTISLSIEDTVVPMAYMDVSPVDHPNGKTIVLLHGKNFTGYYWKEVIRSLSEKGYRVIAPDQLGWGRSASQSYTTAFIPLHATQLIYWIP